MPTKYFIQNKRKSLDQDFFAECMQNDQKRQCLGLLNYDRGCEWKQEESVAEINPASDMEETMEEGEVSNGCGMMQLENSSNGFSNNNNNNNNSSIVNENNNNTFHHQQLQQQQTLLHVMKLHSSRTLNTMRIQILNQRNRTKYSLRVHHLQHQLIIRNLIPL
ncbi:transcription factor mef2A-like isoform X2 [Octopus sinensis]|uniref:Transcription factor mef2A-like isoform X2 n=1 Tax=Octopus sinensis TaxID=2607531 RepID=A0A7E6EYQ6_9MOLL|nr:transcription factor mef2A-like isoform X2 [Octopus sinensis]